MTSNDVRIEEEALNATPTTLKVAPISINIYELNRR